MECIYCHASDCMKAGTYGTPGKGVFQRYKCPRCYRTFKGEKLKGVEELKGVDG